jgi:hypothetical protein
VTASTARVEVEQHPQRLGVFFSRRRARELFDPHRRRVRQPVHHPSRRARNSSSATAADALGAQSASQPGQLCVDYRGRPRPQADHRRGNPGGVDRQLICGQFGLDDRAHGDLIALGCSRSVSPGPMSPDWHDFAGLAGGRSG